jgi:hypothetical protein
VARAAVICPVESMFWRGIIRILQADDRLDVLICASPHELLVQSRDAPVDVVIAPWSRAVDGYAWLDRLGHPACGVVIGVDDITNEAVLWVQQMNRDTLLDLSQRLSGFDRAGDYDVTPVIDIHERRGEIDGSSA